MWLSLAQIRKCLLLHLRPLPRLYMKHDCIHDSDTYIRVALEAPRLVRERLKRPKKRKAAF